MATTSFIEILAALRHTITALKRPLCLVHLHRLSFSSPSIRVLCTLEDKSSTHRAAHLHTEHLPVTVLDASASSAVATETHAPYLSPAGKVFQRYVLDQVKTLLHPNRTL